MGADANVYNDIDAEITTEFTAMTSLLTQLKLLSLPHRRDRRSSSDGEKGSVIVPKTPFYAQWVVSRETRVS